MTLCFSPLPLRCCQESQEEFLLCVAVQDCALPLGIACSEVELESLALKGGLERFLVGGRHLVWWAVGCACVGGVQLGWQCREKTVNEVQDLV